MMEAIVIGAVFGAAAAEALWALRSVATGEAFGWLGA